MKRLTTFLYSQAGCNVVLSLATLILVLLLLFVCYPSSQFKA